MRLLRRQYPTFSQWAMSVVFVGKQGMAFFPNINRLFNF
jgi:hypothetical protein